MSDSSMRTHTYHSTLASFGWGNQQLLLRCTAGVQSHWCQQLFMQSGQSTHNIGAGVCALRYISADVLTPNVVRGCRAAHWVSFIHLLRSSVMGGGAGLRMPLHSASYSSTLISCSCTITGTTSDMSALLSK